MVRKEGREEEGREGRIFTTLRNWVVVLRRRGDGD